MYFVFMVFAYFWGSSELTWALFVSRRFLVCRKKVFGLSRSATYQRASFENCAKVSCVSASESRLGPTHPARTFCENNAGLVFKKRPTLSKC